MNDAERAVQAAETIEAALDALDRAAPVLAPALQPIRQALAAPVGPRRSVYLLGTIKSGKSTLVNALLGRDVMPRGAGVKTFSQTRARRGDGLSATIHFLDPVALAARLDFDFRMLGMPTQVPEDPWSEAGCASLQSALEAFEALCREDERLADVDADASLLGLLPRSLARLRRSIRGIASVRERVPEQVLAAIAADGALRFDGDDFEDYLRWTESADEAALIRDIELTLPPDDAANGEIELVDCQGSDSLNALDFADVERAFSQADVIVYVIQSRLGLRQGDRDLLRQLARAGAAPRVRAVLNVDAFDPMGEDDFRALCSRTGGELLGLLEQEVELLPLAAVAELDRQLGDDGSAELMRALWERREASAVLDEVLAGFDRLRTVLATEETCSEDGARAAPSAARQRGLAERALTLVDAALGRDARLLGKDSSGADRAQALAAVQRILDGERMRLRETSSARVDEAFADDAPLAREIDEFLARGGTRYERERPLPEALLAERKPSRTLDAALARFNEDWLGAPGSERAGQLAALREWLAQEVMSAHERIERMLPPSAAAGAGTPDRPARADAVREDPAGALARTTSAVPVPTILSPVALPLAVRQALATEFVSRGWLARLKRAEGPQAEELLARRAQTLWQRSLGAAFRQARSDRDHQLPSARENFKFQYCNRIVDTFIGVLAAELLADVERHHADLGRLAASERLLLDADAREALEAQRAILGSIAAGG